MKDTPPQNPDMERAILSAILFEHESMSLALNAHISDTSFSKPAYGVIFKAMEELSIEGHPIDQITLSDLLRQNGRLEQVGGEAAIAGLSGEITGAANVEYHCKAIRKLEYNRKLCSVLKSCVGMALDDNADPMAIVDTIKDNIARLQEEFGTPARGITEIIREFIESTTGSFQSTEVIKYAESVNNGQHKTNNRGISAILCRMLKENIIERHGDKNGVWRKVDGDCVLMDWMNADITPLPVKWPFGIEKYAAVMPKSIVIVSGESNAGKTAFLLNTALKNMDDFDVSYFNSEMCEEELLTRVIKFDTLRPQDWKVKFYSRHGDFADVIKPDGFNIIDYLEVYEDFYKIGGYLKDISKKLKKGIAVIALQKDPKKDFGQGGAITKNLSRLYLSLKYDKVGKTGVCEIEKGKIWADCINPDHMTVRYRLHQGAHFHAKDWEMP